MPGKTRRKNKNAKRKADLIRMTSTFFFNWDLI
jgi:hypothetical protein